MELLDIDHSNRHILDDYLKQILVTDNHRNIKSYKKLLNIEDLSKTHYRFSMLFDKDDVVSIQGIRHTKNSGISFPKNIARISDRYYLSKSYRANCYREPFYSNYVLKNDIEYLVNNCPEIDTAFVSMEGTRGFKHFKRRQLKAFADQGFIFSIDSRFYQTCDADTQTCWQACIYYNIRGNEAKLNLPSVNRDEWMRKNV